MLKKILLSFMIALCAIPVWGAERGEKSLGLRGGYNTRNESPLAGLYFQYAFSSHFRLAPNVDYVFRHKGVDAYSVSVNTQFPIAFDSFSRFALYPFTGVNMISWNHRLNDSDGHDSSSRTSRFGLNFGLGAEFYCTPTLKLQAEGKFNLVKGLSSGVFNLGIGYVF